MMERNSDSRTALKSLEEVFCRVRVGHFVSQFDAMCLSSVEVLESATTISNNADIESKSVVISPIQNEVKSLGGLQGLCDEVGDILNSALITEQTTLGYIQLRIGKLNDSIKQQELGEGEGEDNISNISTTSAAPLSAVHSTVSTQQIINKQNQHQVKKLYNESYSLLASKTRSSEYLSVIFSAYMEALSCAAERGGVRWAAERASHVVLPRLGDLKEHRFLDTTQLLLQLQSLRTLATRTSTSLEGRADLVACRLALDFQSCEEDAGSFLESVHMPSLKKGAVVVLLLWAVSECFNNEHGEEGGSWHDPGFTIFVCLGDLTLLLWMWGMSLSVWRRAGIDYFELLSMQKTDLAALTQGDYTSSAAEKVVFSCATDISLLYLFCFVLFNKLLRGSLDVGGDIMSNITAARAIPSLLLLYYLSRLALPRQSRRVYFRMLWKVLAAPYYSVKFRDGYVGDLLTSLVRVSVSMSFSIIFLLVEVYIWLTDDIQSTDSSSELSSPQSQWWQHSYLYRFQLVPFLTLLPLWLRLMQCVRRSLETGRRRPHLYNALKYACAIMVFSFGVLHPEVQQNGVWILCLCMATCYQYCWDITMDWGLIRVNKSSGKILGLRHELSLGGPWVYYAVMAGNFVLRFAWAITYVPPEIHKFSPVYSYVFDNFQTVMAALEIMRRMVWGWLRLEWECIERSGAVVSAAASEGLVREVAAVEGGLGMGSGVEMLKMDMGTSTGSGDNKLGSLFSFGVSGGGNGRGTNSQKDDEQELEMEQELYPLLGLLPDLAALFPFPLFDAALRRAVTPSRAYPRERFQARVLEGSLLVGVVVTVMTLSAVTRMQSAGYLV